MKVSHSPVQCRFVHVFGDCCHSDTKADGAPLSRQCFLITEIGKASVVYHTPTSWCGKDKYPLFSDFISQVRDIPCVTLRGREGKEENEK